MMIGYGLTDHNGDQLRKLRLYRVGLLDYRTLSLLSLAHLISVTQRCGVQPDRCFTQCVEFLVDDVRVEAVILQFSDELGVTQERKLVLVLLNTAHQHRRVSHTTTL